LVRLREQLERIAAQPVTESMAGIAFGAVLVEHLPPLLAPNPGLSLERLSITTPEGAVEGEASVSVNGLTLQAMMRPGAWLSHIDGDLRLSLPEPVAYRLLESWHLRQEQARRADAAQADGAGMRQAAREQIADWRRHGWVTAANGRLTTNVRLADALLTVNGKSLPVNQAGTADLRP
jgi:uncharacterized protein YdgA (DUF945 family)